MLRRGKLDGLAPLLRSSEECDLMDLAGRTTKNLLMVNEKIAAAAARSNRNFDEIQLVVVTKGQPVEVIQAAISAGIRNFGENYPEESLPKIMECQEQGVKWHMIGHLQSRKARLVCEHFDWMHSLDSLHLAEKMERQLSQSGRTLPALLEFNVGGEQSKSGWLANDELFWPGLRDEIGQILLFPHLNIKGLMTMPPLTVSPYEARIYFHKLVKLRDYLSGQFPDADWKELSMGTSSDFESAVEEGATFVRIGTGILGSRPART